MTHELQIGDWRHVTPHAIGCNIWLTNCDIWLTNFRLENEEMSLHMQKACIYVSFRVEGPQLHGHGFYILSWGKKRNSFRIQVHIWHVLLNLSLSCTCDIYICSPEWRGLNYYCHRYSIFVTGILFLSQVFYFCHRNSIFVAGILFLSQVFYFCHRYSILYWRKKHERQYAYVVLFYSQRKMMCYGVATISRLLKIIGLFCKRAL